MKPVQLIKNEAGGIDLLTERDAGNTVRILTGKPQYSKLFWKRIKKAAETALLQMELWDNKVEDNIIEAVLNTPERKASEPQLTLDEVMYLEAVLRQMQGTGGSIGLKEGEDLAQSILDKLEEA